MNAIMARRFADFVEIRTKAASILPLLAAVAYVFYKQGWFNVQNTVVFTAAVFLFDMATTAINNYAEDRTSKGRAYFSGSVPLILIFVMFAAAAVLGLYLAYLCGIVALAVGIVCFAVGVLYSFGPLPISRTPFGEVCSGGIMGFCIIFLAVYINSSRDALINVSTLFPVFNVSVNIPNLFFLALLSFPYICFISNIMLANNLCDIEKDVAVKRHTLPYFLGVRKSLGLFKLLYYAAMAAIVLLVLTGAVPLISIFTLLAMIKIRHNIAAFKEKQSKSETFPLSVYNLYLFSAPFTLLILAKGLINVLI